MRTFVIYVNVFIIVLGLSFSSNCYANKPYLQENRIAYISKVLQAFRETPLNTIYNTYSYINVIENNNCRSSLSDLKVECLLSYARNNCKETRNAKLKGNCELYSDIIVVNKISEKTFVNRTERYRMLRNTNYDFRTAMTSRLQQKYSRIVTEFFLKKESDCDDKDYECLARELDKFCLGYTNTHSLSWQYCISASLWFIGTSKKN